MTREEQCRVEQEEEETEEKGRRRWRKSRQRKMPMIGENLCQVLEGGILRCEAEPVDLSQRLAERS